MSDTLTPLDDLLADRPTAPPARRYSRKTGTEWFTPENEALYGHQRAGDRVYDVTYPYLSGTDNTWAELAARFASTDVVRGYEEEVTDADGNVTWGPWTPESTLHDTAILQEELSSIGTPVSFEDWIAAGGNETTYTPDLTLTDAWQGIEDILAEDITLSTTYLALLAELAIDVTTSDAYTGLQAALDSDITTDAAYLGIQEIIDDSLNLDDEYAEADERAAIALGFYELTAAGDQVLDADGNAIADLDAYQDYRAANRDELDQGIMGQSGIYGTDAEETFRRGIDSTVYQTVQANTQLIESLGTQSSAAAYSRLGQVSDDIANIQIQGEVKLMERELLMREAEYEALLGRYEATTNLAQSERMGYLDAIMTNRANALTGYAAQLDAVLAERANDIATYIGQIQALEAQRATNIDAYGELLSAEIGENATDLQAFGLQLGVLSDQNATVFAEYQAEMDAVTTHAGLVYQQLMATIGYDEHMMEVAANDYEMYMAPYYAEMEAWSIQVTATHGEVELAIARDLADAEIALAAAETARLADPPEPPEDDDDPLLSEPAKEVLAKIGSWIVSEAVTFILNLLFGGGSGSDDPDDVPNASPRSSSETTTRTMLPAYTPSTEGE